MKDQNRGSERGPMGCLFDAIDEMVELGAEIECPRGRCISREGCPYVQAPPARGGRWGQFLKVAAVCVFGGWIALAGDRVISHGGRIRGAGSTHEGNTSYVDRDTGWRYSIHDSRAMSPESAQHAMESAWAYLKGIDVWEMGGEERALYTYREPSGEMLVTSIDGDRPSPEMMRLLVDESTALMEGVQDGTYASIGDTVRVVDGNPLTFELWRFQVTGLPPIRYLRWSDD